MDVAFNQALVTGFVRAPRGLGANPSPPEWIKPTTHPHQCKHWMLVVTQGRTPVVTVEGTDFNYDEIFNYYVATVGVSPYFTFNGYLFKFVYTGYDAKTGKYRSGGKDEILICTDGLFIESTGHGTHYVSRKSSAGSGAAIGGVLGLPRGVGVIIQPPASGETPIIYVPTTPKSPGSPVLVNTTLKAGPPGSYGITGSYSSSDSSPIASSLAVNDATMTALLATAQPQPTQYYAPPAAPTGMSTAATVVAGLLGITVLGGVVYLFLEPSAAPSP